MDSTWIYNFDCNEPISNKSAYFDNKIIPSVFYPAVAVRSKSQMYSIIKSNPKLSKDILTFFFHTLANSFNFKKNAKFGAPVRIHWKLNQNENIIMNFNDQVELYRYVVSRPFLQSNFGYLVQMIKKYLDELNYGLHLIKNKHCNGKYYYKLGINVTNDQQYRLFASKFI